MTTTDKGVSSVISVILMVAIVVILAATSSVFILDFDERITEPAPNIADTTGEFVIEDPDVFANQFVRITHRGGDSVAVGTIEIIVRVDTSDDDDFPKEARLIGLPDPDERGDNLVDSNRINVGFETWAAGRTIEFRINTSEADFRVDKNNTGPEADTLEVIIVHRPSNAIISEHAFTP